MARPIAGLTLVQGATTLGTLNIPVTGIETMEDMVIHVTGNVSSSNPEYFTHIIHSNLIVKIYEVVFDSAPVLITSTNVKNDHTFEKDVTTKATAILIRLYLTEGGEYQVAESTCFCRHKDVHVPFEMDESLFGASVFDKVAGRLNVHGVNNPTTIAGLTAVQIDQLSALTCITVVTLNRFKAAYSLWNAFVALNPFSGMYEVFGIPANAFANSPNAATAALNGRQLFFALLRGFPYGTLNEILTRSREQFKEALDESVKKHEIDISFNTTANINALVNSRNVFLFNANNDGRYQDAKLIHLSPTNTPTEKETILNDALNGGRLSAIVAESGNSTQLTRVIPLIQLDEYVFHYTPMLSRAVASGSIGTNPNYHTLTGLGTSPWTTAMAAGGWLLPSGYATNADYANAIWGGIAVNYSGARTAVNLAASGLTAYSALVTPLNNNPTFNVEQSNVRGFFTGTVGQVNYLAETNLVKMETLQRVVKYTDGALGSFNDAGILITAGFTSAAGIMWVGYDGFLSAVQAGGMTKAAANKVWCYAQAAYNTSIGTAVHYTRYEGGQSYMPKVLRDSELNLPVGSLPVGLPDLDSLFGTFNSCSCKECQSIYSPAAYLTDLMNWLRRQKHTTGGKSGLDCLEEVDGFERRRDIRYLLLSCENTNTMLPYIDIVNEILSVNLYPETAGSLPGGYTTWADWLSVKYAELQTTKTAEEIMVEPEHRFPLCESLLKDYKYTWALPYDVPYDETFSYLKAFGKEYHEIVLDLSSFTDKYATTQWANAYLGASPNEGTLITTDNSADTNFWTVHFGITPDVAPTTVKPLFKATKLDYEGIQEVLYTYYVRNNIAISILPYVADTCDVDNYYFSILFTNSHGDRLMRFMRLQKKTKLSTAELDIAIYNGGSGIDAAFVIKVASQLHFCEKFNVGFLDLQTWFGSQVYFNVGVTNAYSAYYNGRFKNSLLPQDVITFFSITAGTNYAGNVDLGVLTNADKQMLSVVLNASIIIVDEILDYINQPTSKLTPDLLAKIDGYTQIISRFGLKEGELENTLNLLVDPLAGSTQIKDALLLQDKLSSLRALDLNVNLLRDIAEGSGDYDITTPAQIAAAEGIWDDVEKAFQESRKANPDKDVVTDDTFFIDVVRDAIGVPFGLSATLTDEIVTNSYATLFSDFITNPDAARSISATFKEAYRLLHRIRLLANMLQLDEDGIEAAVNNTITNPGTFIMPVDAFFWFENISLTQARVEGILWVTKTNQLSATLGINQEDLYILIDDYKANAASFTSNSQKINDLYDAMGAESKYIKLTIHEFNDIFVKSKQLIGSDDIIALFDYFDAIYEDSSLFNIKAADIWAWVWNTGPGSPTSINAAISADVLRAVHSNFKVFKGCSDFIVPVKNELRERLRNALVGLYIGSGEFEDENEIYAYYLLDSQMSSCFMTSRIVAAVGTVQLLIHRSLLGLEEGIVIDEANKGQWEWRKNYRVWEANRKVFLYPENWIDPSLRTNKTTLFKEMEDLLQQDEINDSNTETALGNYLVQLHEVANLDVRAMLLESAGGTSTSYASTNTANEITHLFARTWNPPYVYYYRKQIKNVWQAWEKMDVEIVGDHIIPVFFNRKLYLFFPMFTEHFKEVTIAGILVQKKYYEIQMSYTKYDFGKWSQKKVLPAINSAGEFASRWWGIKARFNQKLGESLNHLNGDPYNGAVVWSNLGDYTKVTMDRDGFYFHPKLDANGNLEILCRRDFHPDIATLHSGYSEMGYEIGWKISAADERIGLYGPALEGNENSGGQRYLSRPFMTKPKAQQMVYGKDNFNQNTITNNDKGLWVKTSLTWVPSSNRLLSSTPNGGYILTYPIQYKHNLQSQPFFYRDDLRNFYVKKEGQKHRFYSNNHPYTDLLLEKLNAFGIDGLLNPDNLEPNLLKRQMSLGSNYFPSYTPDTQFVDPNYPRDEFDFALSGPYSLYNWEVFFHSASLFARQLRLNNKFAEAIRWLSFVFDPTELDDTSPKLLDLRYWQIKPFFQNVSTGSIRNMMRLLSTADATLTQTEKDLKADFKKQIAAWENHPFDPHMIASMRPRAYMLWVVMEYITTLTDWGDYLFRQDTMESINEAINLYVIASEILGTRPKSVNRPEPAPKCFDQLEASLDDFSNVLVKIENYLPSLANCNCGQEIESGMQIVCYNKPMSITVTDLYFCVPGNPKIVEMWDRVEDRLFKIRHCMNIDGKVRSLALFAPPIDPAMLVQAVAGGLSIADALADMAAPLPYYRFTYLLQRANEYCGEVKGLGSQLISLYEKKDAEELALFRQVQEQNIQNAARAIKVMAIEEANQNYATLDLSRTLIQIKLDDYQAREYRNPRELSAMDLTRTADGFMYAEQGVRLLSGLLNLIPDVEVGANISLTCPAVTSKAKLPFSGEKLSIASNAAANALGIVTSALRNKASQSLTFASYDRRQEDWNLQIKSAKEELTQVNRQLLSSKIRISMAEKELANHDVQIEQSKEMYNWLKNKFTNMQLYSWMIGQVKTVYRQSFNLAYNMAKKAQVSMDYEFGNNGSNVIQYGQWDSAKSGFMAGERLSLQLKQLETEYIESNKRDYELTKNISLSLLDPYELEKLKATGKCDIRLPEILFDIDHPTHYFRRIKSVSISIPCIAGPNTNINATLVMQDHQRRNTADTGTYATPLPVNSAFGESIATSSAQNDSGVFELNFKDERFVPFEGKGAISTWKLEISSLHVGGATDRLVRQFDFSTIADVVMHMKYTAKDGGLSFASTVKSAALTKLNAFAASTGSSFLYAFSLKHDMPDKWHEFKNTGATSVSIDKNRLPYVIQALGTTATGLSFVIERNAPTTGVRKMNLLGTLTNLALMTGSTKTYTAAVTPGNMALGTSYAIDDDSATLDKAVVNDIIVVANITLA